MRAGKKRGKVKGCRMNSIVAGIDLVDRESLTRVLSDRRLANRFTFPMDEEMYAYFASKEDMPEQNLGICVFHPNIVEWCLLL